MYRQNKNSYGNIHSTILSYQGLRLLSKGRYDETFAGEDDTLQAHRNVFNKTMDPTCPHCQLEGEDLRHMACRCLAFHDDRVSLVELLKQIILQETSLCIWNSRFSDWEIILRVLVCPDLS